MRKKMGRFFMFAGLALTMLTPTASLWAKDTIIWMNTDFPPVGIAAGPNADQGLADLLSQLVAQHLPNYNHAYRRANLKRILLEMERGQNVCVVGLIKTPEREQVMYYTTLPTAILTPAALAIRKGEEARFSKTDTVSLADVLQNQELRLGLADKVSFSKDIDSVVEQYRASANIYYEPGSNLIENLLRLMIGKRQAIDYTIAYPWMIEYLAQQLELAGRLSYLKIQENTSPILYYAGCPKNDWGAKVISEIDTVVKGLRATDEYRQILERWMIQDALPEYRTMYDNVFLKTGE